jgi:uncharacterized protein (UPF0548 family)
MAITCLLVCLWLGRLYARWTNVQMGGGQRYGFLVGSVSVRLDEGAELFHLFGDDVAAAYFDLNGNGRPNSDAPDDLAADPGSVG